MVAVKVKKEDAAKKVKAESKAESPKFAPAYREPKTVEPGPNTKKRLAEEAASSSQPKKARVKDELEKRPAEDQAVDDPDSRHADKKARLSDEARLQAAIPTEGPLGKNAHSAIMYTSFGLSGRE